MDASEVGVYDGDTSYPERTRLRKQARLLITNPDMLHCSILPHHKTMHRILCHLQYVVIDEAHAYCGAFGCHAAIIFRRLRRICECVYGIAPTFVVSSATMSSPKELAFNLVGLKDFVEVTECFVCTSCMLCSLYAQRF